MIVYKNKALFSQTGTAQLIALSSKHSDHYSKRNGHSIIAKSYYFDKPAISDQPKAFSFSQLTSTIKNFKYCVFSIFQMMG